MKRYREYGWALLLLAACGVLALVLAAEWLHYRGKEAALRRQLAEKVEVRLPEPEKDDEARYELPGADQYGTMLERPLFMESRRPAEKDDEAATSAPQEKTPLSLKFMGALFAPGQTVGVFVDAKGKSRRRHPGNDDPIDGWTVVEITPEQATVEQGGLREELKLVKPKPKKVPGQPMPAGFPGAQPPIQPVPQPGMVPYNPPPPPAMEPDQPVEEPPPPPEDVPNE